MENKRATHTVATFLLTPHFTMAMTQQDIKPEDRFTTLMPRLANIGGELLVDVLRKIRDGIVRAVAPVRPPCL